MKRFFIKENGQFAMPVVISLASAAVGSVIWVYGLIIPIKDEISDTKSQTVVNTTNISNLDVRLTRIENKIDASLEAQGINPKKYDTKN